MIDNPAGIGGLAKVAAPGCFVEIVFLDEADFMNQGSKSRELAPENSDISGLVAEMETL